MPPKSAHFDGHNSKPEVDFIAISSPIARLL